MMARAMQHPYTGELVVCAQHEGEQHAGRHAYERIDMERCESCDYMLWACLWCMAVITCCPCGRYHSVDCPWPL